MFGSAWMKRLIKRLTTTRRRHQLVGLQRVLHTNLVLIGIGRCAYRFSVRAESIVTIGLSRSTVIVACVMALASHIKAKSSKGSL